MSSSSRVTTTSTAPRLTPERAAVLVACVAWLAMAVLHGADVGLPGHDHAQAGAQAGAGAHSWGLATLASWALMCVAMMVPAALPAVRHVAANSLRRRRRAAVAEFLVAYLAGWVAFGAVALPAIGVLAVPLGTSVVPAALVVAAAWQVLPFQRWFLWACHRTVPLPPRGRLAIAGCVRFGVRQGLACVGVCWPFMLVMAALWVIGTAGPAMLLWMAVLAALSAAAKLVPRSCGWGPPMAFGLGTFALALLVG